MSGGGNGSPAGSSNQTLNCENISFTTNLESVQAEAKSQLEVDQRLPISVEQGRLTVLTADASMVAGTVTWTFASRLVECIEDGYEYVAIVRSMDDGLIKVAVQCSGKP